MNKKYWRSMCWTYFIPMAVKYLCRIMLPAIKSKKVKNYLQQKEIKILEWPDNCPDLNRMENCWQKIKYLMKQENPKSGHPQKSVEKGLVPGGALGLFQKFCVSMLKRLQMVIKNKGNMTKY